jgi:hypothetical protein
VIGQTKNGSSERVAMMVVVEEPRIHTSAAQGRLN